MTPNLLFYPVLYVAKTLTRHTHPKVVDPTAQYRIDDANYPTDRLRSAARSNRDKRTLLGKLVSLVSWLGLTEQCYLVADAYYAKGKAIKGMLAQGHDLVTRTRSDCVALSPV